MPHEATVEELAKRNGFEVAQKIVLFFKVWGVLPPSEKKIVMLAKLPKECRATLEPYLSELVRKHIEDPHLKLLKR
ncbi:hypothetical protein DIPPA_15369 [Diplonema papillatum]|nr:hypothetical protein DIPPA_15369 [Diplonema papillatum]